MRSKWRPILFLLLAFLFASSVVGCQASPTIAFSPPSFSFNAQQGETNLLTDTLHISNSGGGTLDWSVSDDAHWLTLSPTSGSLTGEVDEVTVSMELHINGMNIGNYTATITIFAPEVSNAPQTMPVRLTITENPQYIYENGAIESGGDGKPIELINNPNATNPTYAELVAFIKADTTDTKGYVDYAPEDFRPFGEAYVCSDFAEDVHNNAEAAGIRVAWVGICLEGKDKGHALNAFETTDRGLVYIDCTGEDPLSRITRHIVKTEEGFSFKKSKPTSWDKVAYVEIGKEYGVIDIAKAGSLSYNFYEEYKQKCENFDHLLSQYNDEIIQFNQEISEYGKLLNDYNDEVTEYNSAYSDYKRLMAFSQDAPRRAAEAIEIGFFIQYLRTFKGERKYLEEQGSALKEWLEELEDWEARLKEKGEVINELGEELGDYWFEPLGIVEDIHIHWGGRG